MRYLLTFFIVVLLPLCHTPAFASRSTPYPRDFNAGYSVQDKEDIRYIVLTLAANNPVSVLPCYKALTRAGDRIAPVHPLPFLECIFTDEELKVGIRNLKKSNGKLWQEFMEGLSGSLTEEHKRNNLTDEMVAEFAQKVGIDVAIIQPMVAGHRWYDLVNTLIVKLPRKGNLNRYNM